ncbi:MAG: HYR domain-containing protein, partial [Phaeodactylibacter sp.]|nr:HYR domain-containing protein [Phaeodactylibacter sp.]
KDWVAVSVGRDHYLAIASDGTLWGAGQNSNGSVGTGGNIPKTRLTQIGTDTDWMQVSAGSGYTIALKTDGSLYAWGNNGNGQLGLGYGGGPEFTPVAVQPGTSWLDIAASGGGHSYAIRSDNALFAWGANGVGQLGIGTSSPPVFSPTQIPGNWVDVESGNGNHVLAINNLGELYAWGLNGDGQLGQGSITPFETTPQQVSVSGVNWIDIGAGNKTSVALASNGTLYSWGDNTNGKLGSLVVPVGNNQLTPAALAGTDWSAIQGFDEHFMGRKTDGSIWSWGVNSAGELVDGTQTSQSLPVMAGPDMDWTAFDVGVARSVAIKSDGTLHVGGNNSGEFLGVAGSGFLLQWVQVAELNAFVGGTITVVSTPAQGTVLSLGSHTVTVEIYITPDFGDPPFPIICEVELIFVDQTPPTIICPEDVCEFFPIDNGGGVVIYPDPIASDNCNVTVTCIPPAGAFFNFGITTVNCTAMDDAGNLAVCNFDVEVKELVNVCDTACVVEELIIDTGYDPLTGGTVTPGLGLGDPLWTLISVPASAPDQTVPRPAFVIDAYSGGWATLPGTEWLSSEQFPNYPENNCSSGNPCLNCDPFIFERCFCLCDDGEVLIDFDIYHDDLARVYLYDATLGTSTLLYEECTASTGNFTGTAPHYDGTFNLLAGSYCLRVELLNASSVAMGFDLDGSITGASVESDACCSPLGSIFGAKFNDLNNDGEWDQTLVSGGYGFYEPGLEGWEITLCDDAGNPIQTVLTDADGNYAFVGLAPGTYTV